MKPEHLHTITEKVKRALDIYDYIPTSRFAIGQDKPARDQLREVLTLLTGDQTPYEGDYSNYETIIRCYYDETD